MKLILFLVLTVASLSFGCGVKGDPVPPEKAPELGRGRPNFKRAAEGIRPESVGLAPMNRTYREDEAAEDSETEIDGTTPNPARGSKNNPLEESR